MSADSTIALDERRPPGNVGQNALGDPVVERACPAVASREVRQVHAQRLAREWIATHPNLVDMLSDRITTQIKMVTALRVAVKESRQAGLFPNVIFSPNEYRATMTFLAETRGRQSAS